MIVGAGAAGLWAAAELVRRGRKVLLLEKERRTGTKILASGGTHCNLTTSLESEAARALFGKPAERFLRPAFRALDPLALRARFERLGVESVEAPLDKVFPKSGRARDVRDALERAVLEGKGQVQLESAVRAIQPSGKAWSVHTEKGQHFDCEKLLLAAGGKSYPGTGTTGDGYAWLRTLGCELVATEPALVPLVSRASWVHDLTGLALQNVELRLVDEVGKLLSKRARPVLFTHFGLSGPGAMDVSVHVARHSGALHFACLDLAPEIDREALRTLLVKKASAPGAPRWKHALPVELPRRLRETVAQQAGLSDPNPRMNGLSKSERHALVETLKGLRVPIHGTLGYDKAEVTAGGLALEEVDPGTMQLKRHPNLFVFGELLDLDGPIGGLNFQAAFATAELAARAV